MYKGCNTENAAEGLNFRNHISEYSHALLLICAGNARYADVCLVDALRAHGVKLPYQRSGPFWAMADGNKMLLPFKLLIQN